MESKPNHPLSYASPTAPGSAYFSIDRAINFTSGLQVIFSGAVLCFVVFAIFRYPPRLRDLNLLMLCWVVQWPGYCAASTLAFLGSRSLNPNRRQALYSMYAQAFPLLVGLLLVAVSIEALRGNTDAAYLCFFPIVALFANPALIVLGFRRYRHLFWPAKLLPSDRGFDVIVDEDVSRDQTANTTTVTVN